MSKLKNKILKYKSFIMVSLQFYTLSLYHKSSVRVNDPRDIVYDLEAFPDI